MASNSNEGKKKYGLACMRKRIRFNPNVVATNHPGCIVAAQSKRDKEEYQRKIKAGEREVKYFGRGEI